MAVAPASGMGPDVDACSGAAVVRRDLLESRRYIFRRLDRRRHAEQAGGAGIARGAAWALSAIVLGDVLAGSAAGGNGGAGGVAGEARARRAVPAGLAGPVLDRVRAGADQAAALCAAALSGDRHVDGRGAGTPRAVAIVVDERRGLVVRDSRNSIGDCRRRRHHGDASADISGMAVRGGGADLRIAGLVALRG